VVHGVKVLGHQSKNGREYTPEAIQAALPLYEGVKVNVNHPKKRPDEPRDYQDRFGTMRAVEYREGAGLFADFHFNPAHPVAEQFLHDAEHAPENVGFSHNAQAMVSRNVATPVVEEITKVLSVDLVADPATTSGVFEWHEPEKEFSEMPKTEEKTEQVAAEQTTETTEVKTEPQTEPVKEDTTTADAITKHNEAVAENHQRIADIEKACEGHPEIAAKAIKEEKTVEWCELQVELTEMRNERASGPGIHVRDGNTSTDAIECALARAYSVPVGEHYDEKTLEASDRFGNLSLCRAIELAARQSGQPCRLTEALNPSATDYIEAVHSVAGISGLLGNVLNKSLIAGFSSVRQPWREIATIGTASDYKSQSMYRITSDVLYSEVPVNGDIPTTELGESDWSIQCKRYARMLTIDEMIIKNDDLSAILDAVKQLGAGGARTLDKAFWTAFAAMSFTDVTGASDLSQDGFDAMAASFASKTITSPNTEAEPLDLEPAIIVVHGGKVHDALRIIRSGETTNADGLTNTHAGMYKLVSTNRLASSTPWYALADPVECPIIKVAFLDGVQQPTLVKDNASASSFNVSWRYAYNFGIGAIDANGGVKMAGTAS